MNSSYPPPILRSTVSKITALSPSSVSSDKRVEKAAETAAERNIQKNITVCLFVCPLCISWLFVSSKPEGSMRDSSVADPAAG